MSTVQLEAEDKKSRYIALAGTLLLNGAIIALLFFIVIRTPIPPFPESGSPGMEVNFGYSDEGMGEILTENEESTPSAATQAAVQAENRTSSDNNDEKVVTAATGENVTLKQTETSAAEKAVPQPQVSTELMAALNKLKKKKESGSDGITGTPGNQGDPNGTNNTTNYSGTPGEGNEPGDGGRGTRWSLKGRKMLLKPELVDDSQESGVVVVEITVNKNGVVTYASPGARGSTTTNAVLYAKARQAAMKAKFNPSADGTEEQRGTITFNFILN